MRTKRETIVAKAVRLGGGPKEVARKLDIKNTWAVRKWLKTNRVPPYRVIPLAELTNGEVSRSQLDPVLYPDD